MTDPFSDERDPEPLGGQFNFVAGVDVKAVWSDQTGWSLETAYTVRLPGRDFAWTITRSADPDTAVAEMEMFVREARAALAKLKKARKAAGHG